MRWENSPYDDEMVVESDSHLLRPSFVRRELLLIPLVHQNHVQIVLEECDLSPTRMVADPGYRTVGSLLVEEALAEDLEESRRACEKCVSRVSCTSAIHRLTCTSVTEPESDWTSFPPVSLGRLGGDDSMAYESCRATWGVSSASNSFPVAYRAMSKRMGEAKAANPRF